MSAEEQLAAMDDEAFDAIAYGREEAFVRRRTQDAFRLLSEANLDATELAALRRIEEESKLLQAQRDAYIARADGFEEQYGKLHLAAEAVFRSENKRDGGVYVNAQDMEALGAALNPARRIPDA